MLVCCGLSAMNRDPPRLFAHLDPDCKPIRTQRRKFSQEDSLFISSEIAKLLDAGICVPSISPWRAQVLVNKNEETGKRRLCIDYSQTINRYTHQDGYPLPNMHDQATEISKYKYYSHFDLTSAYHQIPLHKDEQLFTAFEANGNLYEFTRVPFGVTNGPAIFQREMDNVIREDALNATWAYIDNITVAGMTKEEHDENLQKFREVAKAHNFTFNEDESIICSEAICLLGYRISQNSLSPDPDRLRPLQDLPAPENMKALKRVLGMFAYYSCWIPKYSDRIQPLLGDQSFPLKADALAAFNSLKKELETATIQTVDENVPFTVETDASGFAIAAILNQGGRPVAFFSRSLKKSEKCHHAIEKEACAIVEALRKWKHYLYGRHFTLFTDQEAVSYIFDRKKLTKIKNDKLIRWRCELAGYFFDIVHKPGKYHVAPDAMSRVVSSAISGKSLDKLKEIHSQLSHPGVTRLLHFVRSKNLAYTTDEVKSVVANCSVCCKIKPRFYKDPNTKHLIKATQPFERLNLDFKGPLPSSPESPNKYILNIIDEYSRFPFAFACRDLKWTTIRDCCYQLFTLFGMPSYAHSDRGPNFLCQELKEFFWSHGIATSKTTPYNPQGNGQVEKYNGVLWKAINLQLQDKNLDVKYWEHCLPDALHSIRSLLCTATNEVPHDRLFNFHRRTSSGCSLPVWLTKPGPVFLKRHVRNSKYEPLVEEADLLEANPSYAHVKLKSGIEKTVSLRDLAPRGEVLTPRTPIICIEKGKINEPVSIPSSPIDDMDQSTNEEAKSEVIEDVIQPDETQAPEQNYVTRFGRQTKAVDRFSY